MRQARVQRDQIRVCLPWAVTDAAQRAFCGPCRLRCDPYLNPRFELRPQPPGQRKERCDFTALFRMPATSCTSRFSSSICRSLAANVRREYIYILSCLALPGDRVFLWLWTALCVG